MKKTIVLMLVLALFSAAIVSAADYGLNSVSGVWTSVSGGSGKTGINTNEVRWGTPTQGQKSGLRFDGTGASSFNEGDQFLLGTLKHFNWPVNSGTAADGATLQITLAFSSPAVSPNPEFTFDFNVDETPNTNHLSDCNSGFQVSSTPCDDKITFPSSYGEESVQIGDKLYTIKIDGFVDSFPSGSPVNQFITEEQKDNTAYLVGTLSSILVEAPQITLVSKTVNGQVEETGPGLTLYVGDPITWEYLVQNTGNVALTDIAVTDDQGVVVNCPQSTLAAGDSMTCTGTGTAVLGSYVNTATATAKHASSTLTSDEKAAYYLGINAPTCGDGVKDSNEECDGSDGVGLHQSCDKDCKLVDLPYCGDDVKNGAEECDGTAGVGLHQSCNADCELVDLPYCGDDVKNGAEECDGTAGVGLHQSCNADCELVDLPYCGDGNIDTNEQCEVNSDCDDSNSNTADTCNQCTCQHESLSFCGDGVVDRGEQCDYNNGLQCTPACDSSCTYCDASCKTQTNYGGQCGDYCTLHPTAPGCGTTGVPFFTPITAVVAITIAGLGLAYFRKQN